MTDANALLSLQGGVQCPECGKPYDHTLLLGKLGTEIGNAYMSLYDEYTNQIYQVDGTMDALDQFDSILVPKCPVCGYAQEHAGDCIVMNCPACSAYYCYWCNQLALYHVEADIYKNEPFFDDVLGRVLTDPKTRIQNHLESCPVNLNPGGVFPTDEQIKFADEVKIISKIIPFLSLLKTDDLDNIYINHPWFKIERNKNQVVGILHDLESHQPIESDDPVYVQSKYDTHTTFKISALNKHILNVVKEKLEHPKKLIFKKPIAQRGRRSSTRKPHTLQR
tara:strand:+ start:112 stop:948 length:837 start_codon:yes stop_codon:yes gene_type:complete